MVLKIFVFTFRFYHLTDTETVQKITDLYVPTSKIKQVDISIFASELCLKKKIVLGVKGREYCDLQWFGK